VTASNGFCREPGGGVAFARFSTRRLVDGCWCLPHLAPHFLSRGPWGGSDIHVTKTAGAMVRSRCSKEVW
jgi:hypothetical protein